MRIDVLKQELRKLQLITRASKTQKALEELLKRAESPNKNIKIVVSSNWVYFYLESSKYNPETKIAGWLERERLGKMETLKYNNLDKKMIKEMEINDLKKLLVEY